MAAPSGFPSVLQLPTITEYDLKTFHAQHLSPEAVAQFPFGSALVTEQPEIEDDDGLGYYPDGVKRTLTDEQIAMFRHSEIQTLLRERRKAREKREAEMSEEGEIDEDSSSVLENKSRHHQDHSLNEPLQRGNGNSLLVNSLGSSRTPIEENDDMQDSSIKTEGACRQDDNGVGGEDSSLNQLENDDQAFAEFLYKEQHQMVRKATKRKRNPSKPVEQGQSEKTERRIAREQDESTDTGGMLDYGDDVGPLDSSITKPQFKKQQTQHPLGRRIVAYGDDEDGADDVTEALPLLSEVKNQEKRTFLWPKIGSQPSACEDAE